MNVNRHITTRRKAPLILLAVLGGLFLFTASAQQGTVPTKKSANPTFAEDVFPILQTNCMICHSEAGGTMGGLDMTTYEGLMKGGDKGIVLTPGRSAESRLIQMIEGWRTPKMPPKGDLKPEAIATIRSWIDAGGRGPAPGVTLSAAALDRPLSVPDIKPLASMMPPVSAVAFSPDGARLAVGGYKQVQLIDPSRGAVVGTLPGPVDAVRSMAFSPDGKRLAAAGGAPAQFGEICLWDAATGARGRTMKGHTDYIYSIAFSPDGKWLASGSYDRLIKIWDVESGTEVRTLKDHTDAVYPVAFSPDGKWLASGSADRTVKIWDVASGRRLYTLSEATDVVWTLAFRPSGHEISAASADKTIRTWSLSAQGGTLTQSIIAHDDAIHKIAYTPDGQFLVSTGADRLIKIWDVAQGVEVKSLEPQPDWALDLAYSPDGRRLAVGRYDGSVALYDPKTGRMTLMKKQ